MANVKAGDLAFIARTTAHSPNLGRVVKVLRRYTPGEMPRWERSDGVVWLVESTGSPLAVISSDMKIISYMMIRPVLDSCLRPIRGDETPESTETAKDKEIAK